MGDDRSATLPDGTDTVIEGAAISDDTEISTMEERALATERKTPAKSSGSQQGLTDRFRSSREQLAGQAGEKARGFVTQGLERTAEALANVSRMVGDTAPGIEERLGAEYGDYARRAAGSIENLANTVAEKNPDELIEDTRNFVRNSPGVALAGAAVVGFVVARLLKSGLAPDDGDAEA